MRPTLVCVFALLLTAPGCAALPRLSDSDQEALVRSENASQAPADLIYGQGAAARGDWNTALAFFQPDFVWHTTDRWLEGEAYGGRDGLRALFPDRAA